MLEIIFLSLTCFLNGLLGLVVYTKNPKSTTNRLFIIMIGTFILWSIVNYYSLHPILFSQLIWVRLVLFTAAPLCLMVYLTFTVFPSQSFEGSKTLRLLAIVYTLIVMSLTLTPLVFSSIVVKNGSASPTVEPGIAFFVLLVAGMLGGGIWNLINKYRHSTGNTKLQLRFVLVGIAGTFGLIFITNLLLVILFKNTSFIAYGSFFTLIFTGALGYAIVKHRLFDIRRAATRGLAYLFTISSLALAYAFTAFSITSVILNGNTSKNVTQLVNIAIALALAFSFQRIRQFFDRISNRIFYKDAYDPQEFLHSLNRVLVTQVELKHILSRSIAVIEGNLKCESCAFVIQKTQYFPMRVIENHDSKFEHEDILRLHTNIHDAHQKVIVSDYLEGKDAELGKLLNKENIAVIARLSPNLNSVSEYVGDIMLGPKKSGDPYTPEDVKLLEIIANELVIAIQNALRFEQIENFNLTLQAKVDEATRKLRRANERLKELDESKDDFISMASHQLRTPLTSIKGYISMVLEGDAGKVTPMEREMLGQAFFSAQRMVYLIADLLNVSRLKTGKFIIEKTKVNLASMVVQELQQLKETAESRQLKLTYDKPANFPDLMLDETKTRQVIMNFVDNAIYYTPAGGHVNVRLIDTPTTVELRVEDDGIGVAKSDQPHLFTKFYRAGNARKARPDGTGLGLFMAKKVIIAEEGTLIFESVEGKGSTFGFIFSKAKAGVDTSNAG